MERADPYLVHPNPRADQHHRGSCSADEIGRDGTDGEEGDVRQWSGAALDLEVDSPGDDEERADQGDEGNVFVNRVDDEPAAARNFEVVISRNENAEAHGDRRVVVLPPVLQFERGQRHDGNQQQQQAKRQHEPKRNLGRDGERGGDEQNGEHRAGDANGVPTGRRGEVARFECLRARADRVRLAEEICDFWPLPRVLHMNDDPPVQNSPSGLTPPTDFATFMRNYQNMVFSTAARLTGNETQAEDISQEVFLKAHQHFAMLSTSPTAGGWLKTVATNLALNHLTRYRNRWRFFSELKRDDAGDDSDAPEVDFAAPETFFGEVDADERRVLVERALDELPPHQRIPLVLFHFEDLPYDEIAKKLGVSLPKVKTDILRARAALAKILQRAGSTAHESFNN